jgi:TolB-like protein/DNA-binding winged helix-turn-helix (wHTH) protein
MPDTKPLGSIRFGVFEVDLDARELRKTGRRLSLQEQPFQVLALLLERPGELVTREALQAALWPQAVVDFDHGLNKAINKIRDALGDVAENPRFIQTVARRGYRFLADVTVVTGMEDAPPAPTPTLPAAVPALPAPAMRKPRKRVLWTVAALTGLLVLLLTVMRFTAGTPTPPPPPQVHSLAVLPLENLSGDASQDYFADGMTDELITQLAQIGALRVISRSSVMHYRHLDKPLADVARELNVEAVVEGSILRSGERIRITAQLIRVPADQNIWAQSFEGNVSDTLALQSQVAQAVADQIRVALSRSEHAALQKSRPVIVEAYDAYLKGRYYWNRRTAEGLKQAIENFERSIALDPANAEAYAGLADSYALSGDWEYGIMAPVDAFTRAKEAANKALSLDDSLSEAHTSLAFVMDLYDWDWVGAERQFKLALRLSPGYATAHHWYAFHLLTLGRSKEGLAELRKAQSLDPLSPIIDADVADALCIAHRFEDSVQQSRRTLALDPNFAVGHFVLGQALVQQHLYAAAIAELQKAIALAGHRAVFDSNLAYAYAVSGNRAAATQIAGELAALAELNPSASANVALIYAGLGDTERAMSWLIKAYAARFNPSILLRPAFDSLRADPQFQRLWQHIGLPR